MLKNHFARWILGINRSSSTSPSKLKVITNDFIGDEILSYGNYEASEIQLLSNLFDFETKNVDALDIGANIGNHTLPIAELFQQVLAFEPHPISRQLLTINSSEKSNITIFPLGLSNFDGQTTLHYSEINLGKASLYHSQEKSVEVELKRGDVIVTSPIGFIKVDVEGHELNVLRGLEQTIRKNYPIIAFEFNPKQSDHESLLKFISQIGYTEYYVPYKRSLFGRGGNRRFYQRVLDELFFNPSKKLIRLNPKSKQFQNLVFTEATHSKFKIKKEMIIP